MVFFVRAYMFCAVRGGVGSNLTRMGETRMIVLAMSRLPGVEKIQEMKRLKPIEFKFPDEKIWRLYVNHRKNDSWGVYNSLKSAAGEEMFSNLRVYVYESYVTVIGDVMFSEGSGKEAQEC